MTLSEDDRLVAAELLDAVTGRLLTQLCFRTGVRLDFDGAHRPELTIECPLVVTAPDGRTWSGEPFSPDAARELLELRLSRLTSTSIGADGSLSLTIGATHLHVPVSQEFEAWQLRQDNGVFIVSMPGGGIAIWSANS